MVSHYAIDLSKPGADVPWGFRLQGGAEYGTGLSIQRVFSGSPADGKLQRGDIISKVNGNDVRTLSLIQAQELVKSSGNRLSLVIQRDALPVQDLHISAQASSFAPTDYPSPARHPAGQPTQHFHTNSFLAQPNVTSHHSTGTNVSNQPDHNLSHHYQPTHDPAPHVAWQQPAPGSTSSPPYHHSSPQHQYHFQEEDSQHQEHVEDVDNEHLKPVKEIKSMFDHGGSPGEGGNVIRRGHPTRMSQPKKPQASVKYQPPSPAIKPPAPSLVQSAKHPPVYQQRSSYNPLDFKGVTPKSPIPPNRPPGLIQRGAADVKPRGVGMDYQQPNHFRQDQHHQNSPQQSHHAPTHQSHHAPTHQQFTPQGNMDAMTDFYLHGLNAKSEIPDFSKPAIAPYSGKILPPRSEVAIKTPTSAPKKKEFKADQSAVYRILQEEEEASKQRSRGGPVRNGGRGDESVGRAFQMPGSGGQSRLAELLEKDQAQMAPHHDDGHSDQHYQQQQQWQHHQQQQQHYHHPQQQHHHDQRQHQQQSPPKHLVTSTASFLPSPNREQAPRHDYNDYHGNQQQHTQGWNPQVVGGRGMAHSGFPETEF